MKKVSVIGSGTMGNGIAHCFAQYGFDVNLVDISLDNLNKAQHTIQKNLDRMIQKNKITNTDKNAIVKRIKFNTKLDQSVENSDLVIEAATESKKLN